MELKFRVMFKSVGIVHQQIVRLRKQGGSLNAGIQPFSLYVQGYSYQKALDAERSDCSCSLNGITKIHFAHTLECY